MHADEPTQSKRERDLLASRRRPGGVLVLGGQEGTGSEVILVPAVVYKTHRSVTSNAGRSPDCVSTRLIVVASS